MGTAIKTARGFFVEAIENLADEGSLFDLHFEGIEKADNGDWLITVGHERKTTERVYRQVRIDSHTGEPQAITIRSL